MFAFDPKSNGKTTLLMKVAKELPKEKFITGYESVIEVFFKKKGWLESFLRAVKPKINLGVFELKPEVLKSLRQKETDPFEEMRKRLEEDRARGLAPVIVFDEFKS